MSRPATCDSINGVQVVDCGAGQCRDTGSIAGCSCGRAGTTSPDIRREGYGGELPGTTRAHDYMFDCYGGITIATHCRAQTGRATARAGRS